jgi:5-methyltetrahydropteroyltriglutamate--homocysteine methyltransferase
MKVRGQDVLLPTTLVGAYPRPVFMAGKVFGDGVHAPEFPSYRMRELYRHAVALAVKDMTEAGLDIVTDGAQHYENETDYEYAELFHYMAHRLDGYAPYGDRIQVGAFDLPIYKPTVIGPVAWRRPAVKPILEAVREATDKPVKINISLGPASLAALSTDQHYGDLKALSLDVAAAYNRELKDLADRGLEMVQITEPLTFFEPAPWIIEAINTAFEGVQMYRVVHICYGHEEGQPGILDLQANRLFPWAFDLDCDQIHLQLASHDFSEVGDLRGWPKEKDLGVGVIDIEDLRVESPEKIAQWLRKTLEVVPAEQVCVSTDCALASMRRIVAKKKLEALVAGTEIVRAELTGRTA